MKKDNFNVFISQNQKLNDELKYDDIKDNIAIVNHNKFNYLKLIIPIAIVILCLSLIGGGIFQLKKRNYEKEYQEAIEFFNENELDYSDLTQQDVIDIHEDVKSNSFSLEKTVVVIKKVIEKTIKLNENIDDYIETSTEDFWEYWKKLHKVRTEKNGIYYESVILYEHTEDGELITEGTILSKYNDDEVIWSVKLDYLVSGYFEMTDCLLVNGSSFSTLDGLKYISKVTDDGKILWTSTTEYNDGIKIVNETDNKYIALLTHLNQELLVYSISFDGDIEVLKTVDFSPRKIKNIVQINNGCMIYFGNNNYWNGTLTKYNPLLIKIDNYGNIIQEYTFDDSEYDYNIFVSSEYDGKIYFAGYRWEKYEKENVEVGQITRILDIIFEKYKNGVEPTDEEVLELVKNNYTAVLFEYNEESDKLEIIKCVDHTLSHDLYFIDGKLVWQLEAFVWARFSPATSSFTIAGLCDVYNYTLNGDDFVIEKTDETVIYRR